MSIDVDSFLELDRIPWFSAWHWGYRSLAQAARHGGARQPVVY
jgi:hypothetical protein